MKILGIESSCDETAAAIVEDGSTILAQSVASSMDLHAAFGGVVPEIAARSHIEFITPVIERVFNESGCTWDDIDGIAVTYGAGLSGSLLVGVLSARTLAIIKNKPLYGINHVEGHVYANFLVKPQPTFPLLSLIVSGGHSQLVYFRNHFDYDLLGQTVDDEAFDKVAKLLGLPYPGGPSVAKAALDGNPHAFTFPIAKLDSPYNFSFSGLKTAVLRTAQAAVGADYRLPSFELPERLTEAQKRDLAASFQYTAIKTVVDKTLKAFNELHPTSVVIAGGVAANQELRTQLTSAIPLPIDYAPIDLCTDNGAMIATLGCIKAMQHAETADPYTLAIAPNLKM